MPKRSFTLRMTSIEEEVERRKNSLGLLLSRLLSSCWHVVRRIDFFFRLPLPSSSSSSSCEPPCSAVAQLSPTVTALSLPVRKEEEKRKTPKNLLFGCLPSSSLPCPRGETGERESERSRETRKRRGSKERRDFP